MRTIVLLVATVLLGVLCACGSETAQPHRRTQRVPTPSVLGGPAPSTAPSPSGHMNSLERPVARRLADEVAVQGLHLDHLDCPRWDGPPPLRLTCTASVDGVEVRVRVRLHAAPGRRAVDFDAALLDTVVATRSLERAVLGADWTGADCGEQAAYPAEPGTRIVCRVTRAGSARYLVVTVRSRSGRVSVAAHPSGR